MGRFRKPKNRKMKSVEIELADWVRFNEKSEEEAIKVQPREERMTELRMKKREQVHDSEQEERAARIAEEYLDNTLKMDGAWETKKNYVLTRKERMDSFSQELEQLKREYRVLMEYHNDIDLLQDLPDDGTKKLRDIASVLLRLKKDRKSFQEDTTLLDDGKYLQMSRYTEDMPDVIKRLTADEMYVSRLKSEIDRLEGEKGEQQFEGKDVEENQGRMKTVCIVAMFVLLVIFAVSVILQMEFRMDMQVLMLLCGIAFAMVTLGVFIRYFNNVNRAKTAEHRLNKIISAQNKVKMKYVNAKNGVDYVYRKYQVHSASELLFQWEQFIMTKSARENYQRSGNELSYYEERLHKMLEQYRIQDPAMWLAQIEYLADEDEMNRLKKELELKIEETRRKIDSCRRAMAKTKDEVSLLAIKHPDYADAIRELMGEIQADEEQEL